MSTEAVAGLFALGGAALAAGLGWIGAALQRRWSRTDAITIRVFEEKVATYFEFLAEAHRLRGKYEGYALGLEGNMTPAPPPGEDSAFFALLLRLQIYGSAECVRLGEIVYATVGSQIYGGRGTALDDGGAMDKLKAFTAAIRGDLVRP